MQQVRRRVAAWAAVLVIVGLGCGIATASEPVKRSSTRSVHLLYPGPESVAFYNEVTVNRSTPGSYFCAEGFGGGYFGIQEQGSGKKVVIFSIWDAHKGNNRNAVPEDVRVKVLDKGPGVRTGRFGGEGTGAQSFLDFDWKIGTTYRFLVTAKPDGPRTVYTAHFFAPETGKWQLIASFSTLHNGTLLRGYYSFVEDFIRSAKSVTITHEARYGNGWVRLADGKWTPLTQARFSADPQKLMNIDAGLRGNQFFLATGGDVSNTTTPLHQVMTRPDTPRPTDLDAVIKEES